MRDCPPPCESARAARGSAAARAGWRRSAFALLPLLLALAWWSRGQMADRAAPEAATRTGAAAGATSASRERTPATPAQDVAAAPDASVRIDAPAAAPLRRRFETTGDLYAFARDLTPALQRGDPDALWLMSKVADYCAGYSLDPAGFASDTRLLADMALPAAESLAAARERVGRRCGRFAASDGLSRARVLQLREQAARAGSLAAEAALLSMGRPLRQDGAYARDLVARVRDSLDPEAYSALSTAVAGGRAPYALSGAPAPPQFRQLAWQLAACRLGLDCSNEGALMTSYCVNGGVCSQDPAQGFEAFVFDAAVPRQSGGVLEDMVQTLIGSDGGNR